MVQVVRPSQEPSVEELTSEAMRLIQVGLNDLYLVLGCQLMGCLRPSRIAALIPYQTALKEILDTQEPRLGVAGAELDWRKGFLFAADELKQEGISFLEGIADELRKVFDNEELLRCTGEINPSTMQIIVLLTGAVLRMPPQLESVSATVAAILCTVGLKEFCARR